MIEEASGQGRREGEGWFRGFFWGMAHAFDLGGTLLPSREELLRGPAADAAALRGDWMRAIGTVGRVRKP